MGVFKYGTFVHFSAIGIEKKAKHSYGQDLHMGPFKVKIFNLTENQLNDLKNTTIID